MKALKPPSKSVAMQKSQKECKIMAIIARIEANIPKVEANMNAFFLPHFAIKIEALYTIKNAPNTVAETGRVTRFWDKACDEAMRFCAQSGVASVNNETREPLKPCPSISKRILRV